jgi:hypothetical protein
VVVAAVQGFAWYINARRFAEGTSGPRWFLGHATWTPPGGWPLWLAVAFAGTAALAAGLVGIGIVTFGNARAR